MSIDRISLSDYDVSQRPAEQRGPASGFGLPKTDEIGENTGIIATTQLNHDQLHLSW